MFFRVFTHVNFFPFLTARCGFTVYGDFLLQSQLPPFFHLLALSPSGTPLLRSAYSHFPFRRGGELAMHPPLKVQPRLLCAALLSINIK